MEVIDSLCKSIESFGINKIPEQFDNDLDLLMDKMQNIEIYDPTEQWKLLQNNYSRLKYLYEIINFYNIKIEGKFESSIGKFMILIDNQTQTYLKEIDWYEVDTNFKAQALMVCNTLEESLNKNNPVSKLNDVLKAYKILINIVEGIRDEKYQESLDPEFVDDFEQFKKRQRKF